MSVIETLVGREPELRMIHELVDGVGERGAALVLRGEPGREFAGRPHFPGAPAS